MLEKGYLYSGALLLGVFTHLECRHLISGILIFDWYLFLGKTVMDMSYDEQEMSFLCVLLALRNTVCLNSLFVCNLEKLQRSLSNE